MSGFGNDHARKRNGSKISVFYAPTAPQEPSERVGYDLQDASNPASATRPDYGLAPLSDEEVRQLPAAHQFSS